MKVFHANLYLQVSRTLRMNLQSLNLEFSFVNCSNILLLILWVFVGLFKINRKIYA